MEVDNADPASLRHWQQLLGQLGGDASDQPDWSPVDYQAWTLLQREHLNPGSAGGPVHWLRLQPPAPEAGSEVQWQAGDIAEIGLPAIDGQPAPGSREYSVASLPADGRAEFIVRLMTRPDGSPGLASGWLTRDLAVGDPIDMRISRFVEFFTENVGID